MAPAGDPIVSEVKLRSLLHVFDRPDMISRWTGDRTSEIHPEEHFQEGLILQLVATPLKRFMKVKSDCEAGAHLVRDRALKEMMGVWSYIPRDSNSQHGHFLLQRNVIEKIIHYCENYSKRRDLASTDTEIVGPLVNYMQAAEGDEGLKDLHDRIAQVTESLENLRQPWYKAFFSSSSLAVGAAHGNISMGRQPEGSG
ncbi:hypothetical protein FRC03_006036 [Tulasnella sp. 419]|nr:hypothetical protein FRC03_006036 [Tulasnella sp. 419]